MIYKKSVVCLLICLTRVFAYNYVCKIERAEVVYYNNSYYKTFNIETHMVNRTMRGLNLDTIMLKQFDKDEAKIHVSAAKFLSNEYRQGAIQYSNVIYNYMQFQIIMDIINQYCKPRVAWPIKTNVHYRCSNYVPNLYNFSVYLPAGKWRVAVNVTNKNDKMIESFVYATLEDAITW